MKRRYFIPSLVFCRSYLKLMLVKKGFIDEILIVQEPSAVISR
jgi:hypothetical protein